MSLDKKLKDAFKALGKTEATVFPGIVTKIDMEAKTISVKDVDDLEFHDIRLSAAQDDQPTLMVVPKVDSTVLVCQIGNDLNTLFVCMVNEVEKVTGTLKELEITDESEFTIHLVDGVLTINGDGFEGLVKAPELKTQIDKNTAILQAIQQAIQTWTPVSQDGGAAFKAALASVPSMQRADLSNIQNPNIKHG